MNVSRLILVATIAASYHTVSIAEDLKPILHEDPALGRPVEFERDVYPILEANCIACHNVTVSEGDLILENLEGILKGGSTGPALVPGKPEESLMYKLARRSEEPVMPPMPNDRQAKELSPKQLGVLYQWIVEGAKAGAVTTKAMNWQPINPRLHGVYSLDMDAAGRFIAAGRANKVTVYDLARRDVPGHLVDPSIVSSSAAGPTGAAQLDYVHAIAFHPTEPMIATSGFRNVKLWRRDLESIASTLTLPADVQAWTTSVDGAEVVMAVATKGLVVASATTGAERGVAGLEGQVVSAMTAFQSEPRWIVAATADSRLVIVRNADLSVAHKSEPLPAAVTQLTSELSSSKMAALLADGSVRILTVAADSGAATITAEMKSDAGPIQMVTGHGNLVVTTAADKTVQIWNSDTAQQIHRFDLPGVLSKAAVTSSGERAVFVLADGQTILWSTKENKQIALLNTDLSAQKRLKRAEQMKAVFDSRVNVVKAQVDESEKEVVAQKEAEVKAKAEVDKQTPLQADAKAKYDAAIAATAAAKAALDAKADDEALKKAHMDAEKAEAAAKDALMKADSELSIAKKSLDFATAAIGRAETRVGERKKQHETAMAEAATAASTLEGLRPAAAVSIASIAAGFSGDGKTVVSSDAAGTLRTWNAESGMAVDVLPGTKVAAAVTASRMSGFMAFQQTADARIIVRSVFPDWQLAASLGGPESGGDSVFVDRVLALAFSPDGTLLAAGGGEASRSGQLTLWNVADGSLVHQFADAHSDTVYGLDFSADGRLLASASADKFVKVFDVASKQFIRSFEGHTHHVMDVAWKADRTTLASAGADNAIKIWNVETGEQARTITTYTRQVTSLQYVGLQDMIVSSSGDKRVFFHTPGNGNPAREFGGNPDYVYRVATNADGAVVASGGEDGSVRVWNAADAKEIVTFAAAN
ncbi:MAG: c-type cytochrome domain-containing protein [Planctomycetota bacterium]